MEEDKLLDSSYPFRWAYLRSWFETDNLYDHYTLKRILEKYDAEENKEDSVG
jgi:hypothetical protein